MKSAAVLAVLLGVTTAFAASPEQKKFSTARSLFEQKKYDQAIKIYDSISPKSDRWLLALEEKSWAYMQTDQYDKAMAQAMTLTSPALTGLTGTEPYLMRALIQLKSCDYTGVFDTLKAYKTEKRAQVQSVDQLASKGADEATREILKKWSEKPSDWKAVGPDLAKLPPLFFLDAPLTKAAKAKNMGAMTSRIRELAITENNMNHRILQKLNLVEVEAIQRVHIATKFDRMQGEKVQRDEFDLVFEDDNETWTDELGSYQSQVDRCVKKSGRTM